MKVATALKALGLGERLIVVSTPLPSNEGRYVTGATGFVGSAVARVVSTPLPSNEGRYSIASPLHLELEQLPQLCFNTFTF